jgi:colanic acid/amylovoran biosynthesis glycosyltransferase
VEILPEKLLRVADMKVAIFRYEHGHLSERFIQRQSLYWQKTSPLYVGYRAVGNLEGESFFYREALAGGGSRLQYQLFGRAQAAPGGRIDLVHSHFGPDAFYGGQLAKSMGVPHVVTFHGYDVTQSRLALLRMRQPIFVRYALCPLSVNSSATVMLAVSDFIKVKMIAKGFQADRIRRHYLGVDVDNIPVRSYQDMSGERYIVSVGRQVEVKGFDTLIRAFAGLAADYPDFSLHLIGAGPLTAGLKALAATLGLKQRVRFLGALPYAEVLAHVRGARLFVLPCQRASTGAEEALGLVFNEASACGVPVIGTRHGGVPETILEGETGFIVPERDVSALSGSMRLVLDDAALAEAMGRRGREFVSDCFNLKRQNWLLEEEYKGICS